MKKLSNPPHETASQATLAWLVRLRWTAAAGQSATVLVVHFYFGLELPLAALFWFISVTVISNLGAQVRVREESPTPPWLAGALMTTDVIVLTALLALTGGSGNPFAAFYLVHATMALLVMSAGGAWAIWGLCSVLYASLFLARGVWTRFGRDWCGPGMDYDLHLKGMLVAFIMAGAAIAYFVGRILCELRVREHELGQARAREAENDRFAALATLAAGAAHELGSPLGTIAIAAKELARQARSLQGQTEIAEDAELICDEAGRCRRILDRLQQTVDDSPRQMTVSEIVKGIHAKLSVQTGRLQVRAESQALTVFAPAQGLVQSLAALVNNSFDASSDDKPVILTIRQEGRHVEFTIRDSGVGLQTSARLHAGEPFFTTKPTGHGMGLGLFLVRLFANRQGGRLELVSAEEGGTAVSLYLPQPL